MNDRSLLLNLSGVGPTPTVRLASSPPRCLQGWLPSAGYCSRPLATAIGWMIAASLLGGVSGPAKAAEEVSWLSYENCPVMVERVATVPAQDRGFLKSLAVELNQPVAQGATVAELDTDDAELDVRAAELAHSFAAELAEDNADVEFHQVALQKAQEELDSHRAIGGSVSESEIRRLTLNLEQAKLALLRAERAKRRLAQELQLKELAIEAAQERLKRRKIEAPIAGLVTLLSVSQGQSVEAGQTIMEIRNLEHLTVDRLVPINQVNVAELVGADVRVDVAQSDGSSVRLSGNITSYDPQVSSQGLVRVHARIKNLQRGADWILLPGSVVTMHVAAPPQTTKTADASARAVKASR